MWLCLDVSLPACTSWLDFRCAGSGWWSRGQGCATLLLHPGLLPCCLPLVCVCLCVCGLAQAAALLSALASRDDNDSAADSGICQLRASRLELLAAGSSSGGSRGSSDEDKIPVNRDGEPEPASHRWVGSMGH